LVFFFFFLCKFLQVWFSLQSYSCDTKLRFLVGRSGFSLAILTWPCSFCLAAFPVFAHGSLLSTGARRGSLVSKLWTVDSSCHPAVVGSPNSKVLKGS